MTRAGRRVAGILVIGAGWAGILGGAAVANHQFPDVPPGNPFHDDIGDFVDAGCASGFPDGTYRPDDPVKRQQMARFIHACAGRVKIEADSRPLTTTDQTMEVLDLVPGAVEGGGGFVMVYLSAQISSTATTGYPCEARFDIVGVSGEETFVDLRGNTADPTEHAGGTSVAVIPVDGGTDLNTPIQARITDAACTAPVTGTFRAIVSYYPFDGQGNGGGG